MAPIVEAFHATDIPSHLNRRPNGRTRKPVIDLKDCELKELLQYNCNLDNPRDKSSRVVCEPVLRLFRSCANGLTVETTSLEDVQDGMK